MKHIQLAMCLLVLAAGCSRATVATRNDAATLAITEAPVGASSGYQEVLRAMLSKCDNIALVYYYSLLNDVRLAKQAVDTYVFTAGSCGGGDLIKGLYIVNTSEVRLSLVPQPNPNGLMRPLPLSDWKITRDQAIRIALENGGQTFLSSHPDATVNLADLSNRAGQPFQWELLFEAPDERAKLTIHVDPRDGQVVK
jgi:hypothetical protein